MGHFDQGVSFRQVLFKVMFKDTQSLLVYSAAQYEWMRLMIVL